MAKPTAAETVRNSEGKGDPGFPGQGSAPAPGSERAAVAQDGVS